MKKLFRCFVLMVMSVFFLASCEDVPAPYVVPENGEQPGDADGNDGSVLKPYEVGELQANQTGSEVWVHGYIVGSIPMAADGSSTYLEDMTFTADGASTSNICIAASSQETSSDNCVPVQVPASLRGSLVLSSNPDNLGKEVWLKGTGERYYGAAGLKNVSKYSFEKPTEDADADAPAGNPTGEGTADQPYNVAAILALTKALPADTNSDKSYYIEGIVCSNPNIDTGSYGNATYYISDDGEDNGNSFYVYRGFYLGNAKFTSADQLKKGDKVVIYGPVVNYRGNTPETVASKSYLISVNGETGSQTPDGGDDEGGVEGSSEGLSIEGTTVTLTNLGVSAGSESVSVILEELGYANAEAVETVTLEDGATITFDAGSNSNPPKYYNATKGIRVYANNIMTFNGKKPIAKVVMECDEYNGTKYVGNATATISAEGNKLTYCNACETAGTQLRVKVITISYAK